MLLNDQEIALAIAKNPPLIAGHDAKLISNCTYSFRIGRLFEPHTGEEIVFGAAAGATSVSRMKKLGPNETVVVITEETVNVPQDILMSYSPLNSLASQGVMMLNASVVEPGYSGPLSCVLVNLSSQPVPLAPGSRVSKAVFFRLAAAPANLKAPPPVVPDEYARRIAEVASRYNRSFLDIGSVVEKATEAAGASARKAIAFGGLLVLFLLFFAQLEPLITKWLREKTGLVSASTLLDLQSRELELKRLRGEQDLQIRELQRKVDELERAKGGKKK